MNTLYLGDNLPILQSIKSESVDLIYIDPPFNSNRNYSGMIKSTNKQSSSNTTILAQFEDTWRGGMKTYIHEFMFPIVKELHRILKPTGSFYLHCDSTAQAYIQTQLLDEIFGIRNWKNQIIWSYQRWTAGNKNFQRCHDMIFFYAKDISQCKFNLQTEPYSENSQHKGKRFTKFENGKAVQKYVAETREKAMRDVWELSILNSQAKERTGYPTQKPEKLLERIILASSNPGDVVLDCFMGSGTTVVVADKLGRNFIGIDQSPVALAVTKSRLALNQDLFNTSSYTVITKKWDWDVLRKMDDLEFERLMVTKLTGSPSKTVKGGDMGIDGIVNSKTVISIKRSEGIGRNVVDNLMTATRRHLRDQKSSMNAKENYTIKIHKGEIDLAEYDAVLVAFSFGKGTYSEVVDMKVKDDFKILLLTVEDILPVSKPPKVEVESLDDKEKGFWIFTTTTKTTSKIENYSWIIKDKKTGEVVATESLTTQNTFNKSLKKGNYIVICEVVDEDGLSGNGECEVVVK
jgi:DNA modification methylase